MTSMRKNNFDIVRLALASIVVLIHSYDLSGSESLHVLRTVASARLAVEGFFVISGFLIFASYERCATLREYFANRAWRILPGYWLSTLFCLAIALSMRCFHVGAFLAANLIFANWLHPGIPGVFETNPGNSFMNGALWTIKIEVMFYVAVPIIVWLCRRLHRDTVLWTLFVLSLVYRIALAHHETLSLQLPGQLSFFMMGALIHYHLAFFRRHGLSLAIAAAILFALHSWTGWWVLRPASVGVLTLGACLLLPHIQGPTRWGDFSYGTYILHYPIVQLIVAAGLFRVHPWAALLLTVCLVAIGAVLSWNFIEKPSMTHAKSRKLRRAALGQAPEFPPAVP